MMIIIMMMHSDKYIHVSVLIICNSIALALHIVICNTMKKFLNSITTDTDVFYLWHIQSGILSRFFSEGVIYKLYIYIYDIDIIIITDTDHQFSYQYGINIYENHFLFWASLCIYIKHVISNPIFVYPVTHTHT